MRRFIALLFLLAAPGCSALFDGSSHMTGGGDASSNCDPATHAGCEGVTPFCDAATRSCVQCRDAADCAGGESCTNGQCGSGGDVCGDGMIGASETCDDENTMSNDGCSSVCSIEASYTCAGEPSVCSCGTSAGQMCCTDNTCAGGLACSAGTCAVCAPTVDQSLGECASPPVEQCASGYVGYGQEYGQSFIPSRDGTLTAVRVHASNQMAGSGVVAEISIVPDGPLGTPIAVATHELGNVATWYEVSFPTPPAVTAGRTYVIVMKMVGDLRATCPVMYGCVADPGEPCYCPYIYWSSYNDWMDMTDWYTRGTQYERGAGGAWMTPTTFRDMVFEVLMC